MHDLTAQDTQYPVRTSLERLSKASAAAQSLHLLPGWHIEPSASGGLESTCLVVATYRRPEECMHLMETLASLVDMGDPVPSEVVFVDGAADDAFSARLQKWTKGRRLPFSLTYTQSPPGLTRQRNVGIDLSTKPYVVFLDDDSEPLPGFFREVDFVFSTDRAAEIGAMTGCVMNEINRQVDGRWKLRFQLGLSPRLEAMQYHSSGIHVPKAVMKAFSGTRPVNVLYGCIMAFRRCVLEQERFSEFFIGYSQGEDTEMGLRVASRWEVVCRGDARINHHPAPGGRPPGFAKGKMDVVNRYFIWKRHVHSPPLIDRFRFWVDNLFQVGMDLAWFCIRPWRAQSLAHGAGMLTGLAQCMFHPPRYDEPPARRCYALDPARLETPA